MSSYVLAFAVVAAVVVSFSTLSRGREISNNTPRRSERQAPSSDTQPEKLEDYCELPPPLEHGRFSPSQRRCPSLTSSPACNMIPGTLVPPNWVIFHSCLPGYKQQDGKTLSVCVKGKWIPPLPVCVVDGCYLPETPTQGSYKAVNECRPHEVGLDVCNSRPGTLVPHSWPIEYSCNPNHYLNTTSKFSSCDNATSTWTNPVECQDGSPPEIYADTTEVETNEGHFATLRCSARGNPIPTIYWMKAGKSLSDKGGRYKFLSDGSLQIVGLVSSDAGEYICVAYNGVGGPVKKIFNLMILFPVKTTIIMHKTTFPVGSDISIPCYVEGPASWVTWLKDGKPLTPSNKINISESNRLTVVRASEIDSGVYGCEAGTPYQSAYCEVAISVEAVQEGPVNYCVPSPCGPYSQCREVNGHPVCSCLYIGQPPHCRPEYVGSSECSACVNQKSVDPCLGTCGQNARCQVINQSPICRCDPGFTGNPLSRCFPILYKIS